MLFGFVGVVVLLFVDAYEVLVVACEEAAEVIVTRWSAGGAAASAQGRCEVMMLSAGYPAVLRLCHGSAA